MTLRLAILLVGSLGFAACKKEPPPVEPDAAATAPVSPGKTGTASIAGTVRLSGPRPSVQRSISASFPGCNHPAGNIDFSFIASSSGGIQNAFVWIKSGLSPGSYPPPAQPLTIDQKHCEFTPRVSGVQAGQQVLFVNSDSFLHNVKTPSFNIAMPTAGFRSSQRFAKPQVMIPLTCEVHAWMHAYVGVVPHPFFAVTGTDGSFALKNLPAGTYTLEAWHERLPPVTLDVTVADGQAQTVKLDMKAK